MTTAAGWTRPNALEIRLQAFQVYRLYLKKTSSFGDIWTPERLKGKGLFAGVGVRELLDRAPRCYDGRDKSRALLYLCLVLYRALFAVRFDHARVFPQEGFFTKGAKLVEFRDHYYPFFPVKKDGVHRLPRVVNIFYRLQPSGAALSGRAQGPVVVRVGRSRVHLQDLFESCPPQHYIACLF